MRAGGYVLAMLAGAALTALVLRDAPPAAPAAELAPAAPPAAVAPSVAIVRLDDDQLEQLAHRTAQRLSARLPVPAQAPTPTVEGVRGGLEQPGSSSPSEALQDAVALIDQAAATGHWTVDDAHAFNAALSLVESAAESRKAVRRLVDTLNRGDMHAERGAHPMEALGG